MRKPTCRSNQSPYRLHLGLHNFLNFYYFFAEIARGNFFISLISNWNEFRTEYFLTKTSLHPVSERRARAYTTEECQQRVNFTLYFLHLSIPCSNKLSSSTDLPAALNFDSFQLSVLSIQHLCVSNCREQKDGNRKIYFQLKFTDPKFNILYDAIFQKTHCPSSHILKLSIYYVIHRIPNSTTLDIEYVKLANIDLISARQGSLKKTTMFTRFIYSISDGHSSHNLGEDGGWLRMSIKGIDGSLNSTKQNWLKRTLTPTPNKREWK
ncbi:hypothetical protein GQR58_014560 [Nymphon striatum]|nr:hypothetical protein GQR58_014560 [Nymphon striatum]